MDLDDRQSTSYRKKQNKREQSLLILVISLHNSSLSLSLSLCSSSSIRFPCPFNLATFPLSLSHCFVFSVTSALSNREDPCYCHMFNDKLLECAQKKL